MSVCSLSAHTAFPEVETAEPDGLLAVGGDLSSSRLIDAYRQGIFPWFSEEEPILWWSPDPRLVLFPKEIKISSSMQRIIRSRVFRVTLDQAFEAVIDNCQGIPRPGQCDTWITDEMREAYYRLHREGFAHSVEVWEGDFLAGGLYGIAIGKAFFGESMFTHRSNAGKAGLITLVHLLENHAFQIIDCQVYTPHLASMGAREISRKQFLQILNKATDCRGISGSWSALEKA